MHQSSMDKMRDFRHSFLHEKEHESLLIMDFGSQDVSGTGTYRDVLENDDWTYKGVDMVNGNNVDIVLTNPYQWKEVSSSSVDVVVSGQAFEHVEFFWIIMLEIFRILKPGGICCIIAPSGGYEHRYPVDCWRFYADGFMALGRYAQMDVLQAYTQWEAKGYTMDDSDGWKDSVLVAKKPAFRAWPGLKAGLKNRLQYFALTRGLSV